MKYLFSRRVPVDAMTSTRDPRLTQEITAKTHTRNQGTIDHCRALSLQIFQPL
jgi:hypothetical protein